MLNNPRVLKITVALAIVLVVGVALFLRLRAAGPSVKPRGGDRVADDPLEKARAQIRHSADLAACRNALQQVNSYLARNRDAETPRLTAAQREELRGQLSLSAGEVEEIEHPTFTLLDGIHLETSLLFRDAAMTLLPRGEGEPRLPPEQEAAVLFDWVVRQVQLDGLENLVMDSSLSAIPPQLILRRGLGSALERALIFLCLVEQAGHDGCLIAYPDAPGRYWACGVLGTGNQVYLFEPRLGLPLPGPGGKGIATLEQVSAKGSTVLGQLAIGEGATLDITPEVAAGSRLHLAPTLSSLAPRQRFLEKDLAVGARLSVDVPAQLARFRAAGLGERLRFASWVVRLQRECFPEAEGGADTHNRFNHFRKSIAFANLDSLRKALKASLAAEDEPTNEEMTDPPLNAVFDAYLRRFLDFELGSEQPRDLLLHGDLDRASRSLGESEGLLQVHADIHRTNFSPEQVRRWYEEARRAAAASLANPNDARAQADLQQVWKTHARTLNQLVDGTAAQELLSRVAYLKALVKHEQAERRHLRLGAAPTPEEIAEAEKTWQDALSHWQHALYSQQIRQLPRAARLHQARCQHRLAEIALMRKDGEKARNMAQTAIRLWEDLAGSRKDLEATACRYQAHTLKGK